MYDLSRKFRIVAGESIAYAGSLGDAKYIAGEWQIERDRFVEIVRQHGIPLRWKATLMPDGHVRLDRLYHDGVDDVGHFADYRQRRAAALAEHIERVERRRKHKHAREEARRRANAIKYNNGLGKPVWCKSADTPRRFDNVKQAARWAGVARQTLQRALSAKGSGRCAGMEWEYEKTVATANVAVPA